jgi:hypothetical protein
MFPDECISIEVQKMRFPKTCRVWMNGHSIHFYNFRAFFKTLSLSLEIVSLKKRGPADGLTLAR